MTEVVTPFLLKLKGPAENFSLQLWLGAMATGVSLDSQPTLIWGLDSSLR